MGRIYKGHDRVTGKPVLVKVNPRERFRPDVFAQWRHVNEVLAQLGHPVFLPAIDMGYVGDSCWQIVPFVSGESLSARLRSAGRMPFREAATVLAELAEAFQLVHAQGFVHGDLKPARIILGEDGQTRVIDFGELPIRSTDSGAGSMVGTPAYMAPERVRGEVGLGDPQCEVYALGVILYEMMTGALPFQGVDPRDFCRDSEKRAEIAEERYAFDTGRARGNLPEGDCQG